MASIPTRHTGTARFVSLLVVSILAAAGVPAAAEDRGLELVNAAAGNDGAAVRKLIEKGADVNATRADGATALLWAAHWDDLDTVNALLEAGPT